LSGFVVALWKNAPDSESWSRRWQASASSLGLRTSLPIRTQRSGPLRVAFSEHSRGLSWLHRGQFIISDGLPFPGTADSNLKLAREHGEGWISDPSRFTRGASGHFAAVLIDGRAKDLTLVRDRFGIRPLWFLQNDEIIAAASECMMLRPFAGTVDFHQKALRESVMCRWIVGRHHLIEPFRQVLPGTALRLSHSENAVEKRYWSMRFEPAPPARPVSNYVDHAESALRKGFHELGIADQPVAILLSGGIDSSVVAALAKSECSEVIGIIGRLPGDPNVELERALFVAESLSLETLVVDVVTDCFADDFPQMVSRLEQPPRNPNNLVLQQLLRGVPKGIRYVLNGDAAEMMFGLADVKRVDQFTSKTAISQRLFPPRMLSLLARAMRKSDSSLLWRAARLLDHSPAEFAAALDTIQYGPAMRRALWDWAGPPTDYISGTEVLKDGERPFSDSLQEFQAYTFLQSSLIRHDRLTTPLGMEPVFPFLSPSVTEFCLGFPREYRYLGQSKPLIRMLCDRHLPERVSRWPKLGFPVPWKCWLDDHLKPYRTSLAATVAEGADFPFSLFRTAETEKDHEAIWTFLTLDMNRRMFQKGVSEVVPL